jgi:hypothetical protein
LQRLLWGMGNVLSNEEDMQLRLLMCRHKHVLAEACLLAVLPGIKARLPKQGAPVAFSVHTDHSMASGTHLRPCSCIMWHLDTWPFEI